MDNHDRREAEFAEDCEGLTFCEDPTKAALQRVLEKVEGLQRLSTGPDDIDIDDVRWCIKEELEKL